MSDRLDGPVLVGFGDFFHGFDNIGAKGKGGKPAPAGKGKPVQVRPYSKPGRTTAVQHHGKVLSHARTTVTKAALAIGRAQQLLAKPASTAAPTRAAALKGKIVSVGGPTAAAMTPKQKLAVQKHNDAVVKVAKAAKVLAQHAIKTRASVKVLAQKMVAQKKVSKALRSKKGRGGVHVGAMLADPVIGEAVAEALMGYYEAVGASPDPANPGFLDDGSTDPAAAAPGAPDAGLADLGPLTEDPVDSGAEFPAAPDMGTFIPDMAAVGGIAYNGAKGTPDGYVLSYGLATRKTDVSSGVVKTPGIDPDYHYGYVFGNYHDESPAKGIPFGNELKPGAWSHVHGRWILGHFRRDAGSGHADTDNTDGFDGPVDQTEAFTSHTKQNNKNVSYGPLVGNPAMPDFKGMRVDAQGNMFWLPQEAPDWLTFPLKQAAAMTAQAAAKAAKEAEAAAAAAAAKTAADAAAAQAAQDAANALSESQAASTAKVAKGEEETKQAQQATQQAATETEAQQALVQQQTAETAQRGVETEQMRQAGEIMIEQAKRQQAYLAQHPDEEFASSQPPPPSGGEEDVAAAEDGSLEGDAMEDGEPIPGADLMRDEAGEGYQEEDAE